MFWIEMCPKIVGMHRWLRVRTRLTLECLEDRVTPATLTINNTLGTLTYLAGAGVNNAFSLTGNATTYTIQDSAEPITLVGDTAGWVVTPSGAGSLVTGPSAGYTSVNVNTLDGDDTINITSTSSGAATTVNAGGGNDTVNVGNASTGLGELAGALTVDGGGQAGDALTLDDQNSTSGHTYGVSAAGVSRDGTSVLNFGGFASLTLDASDQADTINVTSTASGLGTTVNADGGLDTFGTIDQTTIGAAGLTVNGGGQGETLTINSTATGPETIGVTGTQVTRSDGGSVTFSGLGSLTVSGTNNATGDSFDVSPSATLPITIDGMAPTTSPGDTLNYSGSAGLINAINANNGTITEAGFQPVTYQSIESLTGNSSLVLVLDAGAQANDGIPDDFLVRGIGSTFDAFVNGSLAYTSQTAYFNSIIVNGSGDDDTLTVDASGGNPIPQFGIVFNAGGQTDATGDNLVIIGNGMATAGYNPGGTAGAGSLSVNSGGGDRPVTFSGLEAATARALAGLTLTTPRSHDVLAVDSPAAGQNRLSGTSDGVALTPFTFFDITAFTVDAGANDGALPDDSLTIGAAGLVATGLTNFVFKGGPGNDQLTVLGSAYTTPGSGTGISFQGGSGSNTFVGSADVNFTLQDSGVTSSAGGTIQFLQVEVADLTGGGSANAFTIAGWTGTANLDGAGGGDSYNVTFNATGQTLNLTDSGGSGVDTATVSGRTGDSNFAIDATQTVEGTNVVTYSASLESLAVSGGPAGDAGEDNFVVAPSASTTIAIDGGDPTTLPGDTLNVNLVGTTNPSLNATSTPSGFSGNYTFGNRQPVTFTEVETLSPTPDLAVTKADSPDPVIAGTNVAYTLTVNNVGPIAAQNVTLNDLVPSNTSFVSFTQNSGPGFTLSAPPPGGAGTVTATIATLAAGATATFTLVVHVMPNAPDGSTIANTATVTSASVDSNPANNSASAQTGVILRRFVVGAGFHSIPLVTVFRTDGALEASFFAFPPTFRGGVRVAVGDVNGDGVPDIIVAAGPGRGPQIKVIDGTKLGQRQPNGVIADTALLANFFAFAPSFGGGVFVAAGDVNGDGKADIAVGAGLDGRPHVKVINATKRNLLLANGQIADSALLGNFLAFGSTFHGGVTVAIGDVNGDGKADIITGTGAHGAPLVKAINATRLGQVTADGQIAASALLTSFFAYDPAFAGGVFVAAGDVNGDGRADIITGAGPGFEPRVKVINATKSRRVASSGQITKQALLANFLAFGSEFRGGVRVGAARFNSDAKADILVGSGPRTPARVRVLDGVTRASLDSFFAFESFDGVFVAG